MAADAPGMRGNRSRNDDGRLRDKRDDTHVATIEQRYHRDFGVRGNMHLGTLLERQGLGSLHELIHGPARRQDRRKGR
jgi:hypothetical protein